MDEQFKKDLERFSDLNFETFKALASDASLSRYQKIGFPDLYRSGQEPLIFQDILNKTSNLEKKDQWVLDIGSGCSDLPHLLIQKCRQNNHNLVMIDSQEMLNQLDTDYNQVQKVPGKFPSMPDFVQGAKDKFDVILVYSLAHYIFTDGGLFQFLDVAISLLKPGGQLLLGDIPNISKRKRFFASSTGVEFHKQFMNTSEPPKVQVYEVEQNKIDDGIMLSLFQRYRNFGYETYILPLRADLALANRREDLMIVRP